MHGRDDDGHRHHHPPVAPSDTAAFLYTGTASRGGFHLWQEQQQQQQPPQPQYPYYASNIIRFADDPAASSSRGGRGASAGTVTISCQDCGNQAKKDCSHQRCRTCCKSRGFDCATHVKSTWVPAAKRRERQHELNAEPSKRRRDGTGADAEHNSATSSADRHQEKTGRFPREVSLEAVFRRVRLDAADEADAEVAYQTSVTIAGHVFKGILNDVGPVRPAGGGSRHAAGEGTSATTAAAGGDGNNAVVVAAAGSSSAVAMDPYAMPSPFGGALFFHGAPR